MRFRVPSPPLRTRLLQLLFPPVGMTLTLGSVSPRTILPNLTNSSSDMRRRRSRSFCNLDFAGFKSNGHRRSPGRGGILIVPYGADSGRQRKRCTNRCTKPFRPCPISPTVADYCRRIRLIPLSPASELLSRQRSRVRVSSSPPFFPQELRRLRSNQRGCKKTHFCTLFVSSAPRLPFPPCASPTRSSAARRKRVCRSAPERTRAKVQLPALHASQV